MTYKTLEGVLHPDGRIVLPADQLPDHPVRVMVTLLEAREEELLSAVGDYGAQLAAYEERLARGEIRWQ